MATNSSGRTLFSARNEDAFLSDVAVRLSAARCGETENGADGEGVASPRRLGCADADLRGIVVLRGV